MASPVRGLRRCRAARSLVLNVPKPAMATVSPATRTSVMVEITASVAAAASGLANDMRRGARKDPIGSRSALLVRSMVDVQRYMGSCRVCAARTVGRGTFARMVRFVAVTGNTGIGRARLRRGPNRADGWVRSAVVVRRKAPARCRWKRSSVVLCGDRKALQARPLRLARPGHDSKGRWRRRGMPAVRPLRNRAPAHAVASSSGRAQRTAFARDLVARLRRVPPDRARPAAPHGRTCSRMRMPVARFADPNNTGVWIRVRRPYPVCALRPSLFSGL